MGMFVLVCLFGDTQSHGTSIAVWGETAITGFVLHASKAHCPEMWVPSLICVSTHMPLWQYRTAPVANGVDARRLKTNPSHRKKKNWWGKDKEVGEGERQEVAEEKNNSSAVPHSLKRLFITVVYCQTACLYIHGGIQTNAKLIYGPGRGEMAHHEVTQTDCRRSETHEYVVPSAAKYLCF